MKTIQISTTNLIYYLTKHQDIKRKLLAEILPPLERVKDNIVEDFTYETVMEYEYLQQCYNEVLRIEPPAANSVQQTVLSDTEIGKGDQKMTIKAGASF